jgi:hypothetical protein
MAFSQPIWPLSCPQAATSVFEARILSDLEGVVSGRKLCRDGSEVDSWLCPWRDEKERGRTRSGLDEEPGQG